MGSLHPLDSVDQANRWPLVLKSLKWRRISRGPVSQRSRIPGAGTGRGYSRAGECAVRVLNDCYYTTSPIQYSIR
eukprot:8255342-Pyramimonas_sp.AAC.1